MISPSRLVSNGVWIVGLALGLATWSYARWWAQKRSLRFRQVASKPLFAKPFAAGCALFSLGLALRGRSWWETTGWSVLTALSVLQGVHIWRISRQQEGAANDETTEPHGDGRVS